MLPKVDVTTVLLWLRSASIAGQWLVIGVACLLFNPAGFALVPLCITAGLYGGL